MASDIQLEEYVQKKKARGRVYFYFRVVQKDKTEFRRPLSHPFDTEYRTAYNQAHLECFGVAPDDFDNPQSVRAMCRAHQQHERYKRLPKASKTLRDLSITLLFERWGNFDAHDIKPLHAQALYDSLSDRPATANRRADDASAIFNWGRLRGFCDTNPFSRIERVKSDGAYEPWPEHALNTLIDEGKPHIVKVALVAAYTSQRRSDVLLKLSDDKIKDSVWYVQQGKTKNHVPVPLHPVVMAILELQRAEKRKAGIVNPNRPLLTNERGQPWTASGYGTSFSKELIRLKLRPKKLTDLNENAFRPTFHGLRHTNATIIANTVAKNPELFGGIARIKSMLGHVSEAMSRHYSRMAEAEHMNNETMLLIPEIGKRPDWIGKQSKDT